jgi:hypothetical protein
MFWLFVMVTALLMVSACADVTTAPDPCAGGACPVQCDIENNNPANSTDVVEDVELERPDAPVPKCDWECKVDYVEEGASCINERLVDCSDAAPANATSNVVQVTITYTTAGGWTEPTDCAWTCDDEFHPGYVEPCEADCLLGSCVDFGTCNSSSGACEYASCYHLRQAFSSLVDGEYPIRPVAAEPAAPAYCAGTWTYASLGFGTYNLDLAPVYSGWDQLTLSDLQNAGVQQAFIWAHNAQGGLQNIDPGATGGQCCFKSRGSGSSDFLFGGDGVTPADTDGSANCGGPYVDELMRFQVDGTTAPIPLPDGFFSIGVTGGQVCAESDNPAFHVRRFTGLPDCKAVFDAGLSLGDGVYVVDPDGLGSGPPVEVVCDMGAGGVSIWEVGFGNSFAAHGGWELMSLAQFQTEVYQLAFLWNYGRLSGFVNLDVGYRSNNCCFKISGTANYLDFGGERVFPSSFEGTSQCNVTYTDAFMTFQLVSSSWQQPPLGRDYLVVNAPTATVGCSDADNPGFFVRRTIP